MYSLLCDCKIFVDLRFQLYPRLHRQEHPSRRKETEDFLFKAANEYLKRKFMQEQMKNQQKKVDKLDANDIHPPNNGISNELAAKPAKNYNIKNFQQSGYDHLSQLHHEKNDEPIGKSQQDFLLEAAKKYWSAALEVEERLPLRPDLMNLPLDLYSPGSPAPGAQPAYHRHRPGHGHNRPGKQSYRVRNQNAGTAPSNENNLYPNPTPVSTDDKSDNVNGDPDPRHPPTVAATPTPAPSTAEVRRQCFPRHSKK